jgi:hypothetical protein
MAFLTIQIRVGAAEREFALIVIEAYMIPAGGVMTGRTILPKLSVVFIVLLVAGIAVCRCPFELPVCMARFTGDVHVPALQFEGSEIMVKLCRGPAIGCMTRTTIQTKPSLVRIDLLVTGMAILQCNRKVSESTGIEVTLHAGEGDMFTGELERKSAVIEAFAKAVHAIVAIEASRAKRDLVGGHKAEIDLAVTGVAAIEGKGGDIAVMAIITPERRLRRGEPVARECEAHHLVREGAAIHERQRGSRAAMLRVAVPAAEAWIVVHEGPVNAGDIAHLLRDVCMTGGTAVSHGG